MVVRDDPLAPGADAGEGGRRRRRPARRSGKYPANPTPRDGGGVSAAVPRRRGTNRAGRVRFGRATAGRKPAGTLIMAHSTASLANPIIRDIGPIVDRHSAHGVKMKLAPGTRVISADSHWELTEEIFVDRFPARLKEKAPRVWFDII